MRKLVAVASVILVLSAVSMRVGSLWATGGEPQSNPPNTVHEQAKVADSGTDPEEILGTWIRVSTDGRKDDKIVKMEVKKDPDALRDDVPAGAARFLLEWKTEGEVGSRNRVLLNPTEDPRAIDFFPESVGAPKVCPGIYRLEGDTLTICFRAISGDRPSGFGDAKVGETLDVYQREAPSAARTGIDPRATNPKAKPPAIAEELIGTWVLVGTPGQIGQPPPTGGMLKFLTGRHWTITQANPRTGEVIYHHGGTYKLDGDQYTETVEYAAANTANLIKQTHKFKIKVEGDTYTQIGIDNQWSQVWKRAK